MSNIDPYKILEIKETATEAEIKKAYHKKARKLHPDMGGNPDDFKQLQEAYSLIETEEKRSSYKLKQKISSPFNKTSSRGFKPKMTEAEMKAASEAAARNLQEMRDMIKDMTGVGSSKEETTSTQTEDSFGKIFEDAKSEIKKQIHEATEEAFVDNLKKKASKWRPFKKWEE